MSKKEKQKNNFWEERWKQDIYIPIVIILASISIYVHPFFSKTENAFTLFNFEFQHGFENNELFVWLLLSLASPILIFSIWFLKSKHTWRHYILFPMSFFVYEFCVAFINIDVLTTLAENIIFKFSLTLLFIGCLLFFDKVRLIKRLKSKYKLIGLDIDLKYNAKSKLLYYKLSEWILSLESKRGELSKDEYLNKLYQTQEVLDEESDIFDFQSKEATKNRKIFDQVSIIVLILLPIWYIVTRFIPLEIHSYSIGWFYIHDHGFNNLYTFIWYLNFKIFALVPFMIWFIGSRAWWRHAILVPIILYTYQVYETLKNESRLIDQFELLKATPAILFILGLVLFLSNRVKYQYKVNDMYEEIVEEINILLEDISQQNTLLSDKRSELDLIKGDKNPESLEKNRASLMKLKEALIAELNAQKQSRGD